ncbi:Uncharacterized membrane protein [Actinopolymorpha cephalotaxi]|uniref:Membrane protein n=1 Tax=Actinopolymorpha cephalotaxi TaxID=504797 RepID=A0A1I2KCC9_9ACTN|nr:DUF2231 domain-containing protein [Actinopolymorpha cephalotaxi]NYH85911.1 putative membrane protein [Actinopolymorpha cephalotaxi]SFF62596.1 Uncharacterized membrane protein [Actinopolymorpha cephalotaxi]
MADAGRSRLPAKHPATTAAGPYGHPLHPALVTIPIGCWVASFVFDVVSRFSSMPVLFAEGSHWLVGIGLVGAVVAAAVGLLDFLVIPGRTRAYRTAVLHMSLNLVVIVLYVVNFFMRANPLGPVGWGQLVLSAVGLSLLGGSGYLGGELTFRYGVRVAAESTQAAGFAPEPSGGAGGSGGSDAPGGSGGAGSGKPGASGEVDPPGG